MSETARIELVPKLIPVFDGSARVRGAYGGRGSGKTRTFAKMVCVKAYQFASEGREGIILCGRQFMNSLADSSLEEIKAALSSEPWLAAHFEIGEKFVRTRDNRVSFAFAGLDRNISSIKSKARLLLAWVDEAEAVSEEAWSTLIPTIREDGSELWVTWNPERDGSATDRRFRKVGGDDVKIVECNWRDNPRFPAVLERERLKDQAERPDGYQHIWEGEYVKVIEGAYFAAQLTQARADHRIGFVAPDPLMLHRAFWDIGTRDATAIWIAQFIGSEIRVLDYYEASGQPLAAHLTWLRDHGYAKAQCVLPHDGENQNHITATRFEDHIKVAGFDTMIVRNQGKGAALKRVEAARRLFPSIRFDEVKCKAGLDALGWYHERRDAYRGIGLGPEHDWSSHGADAFGLMCVAHGELVTDGWGAPLRHRARVV